MMRLAPGGPFDREKQLSPEIEANILKAYNLDKPVHELKVYFPIKSGRLFAQPIPLKAVDDVSFDL